MMMKNIDGNMARIYCEDKSINRKPFSEEIISTKPTCN
jgi:hypothetical protein